MSVSKKTEAFLLFSGFKLSIKNLKESFGKYISGKKKVPFLQNESIGY